jgi:sensor histidine kinase YesM
MRVHKKTSFVAQWLLHATVDWLLVNLASTINYLYKLSTDNLSPWKSDGDYPSWLDQFLNLNYYQNTIPLIVCVTLFIEANFHFVFLRRKFSSFVFTSIVAGIMMAVYIALVTDGSYQAKGYVSSFFLVSGYAFLYPVTRQFLNERMRRAEIIAEQRSMELDRLRAQINPHFFFNTLNSIYALALAENADKTAEAVEKAGSLMRVTMNQKADRTITVEDELQFILDYLYLQKLRFSDASHTIEVDVVNEGTGLRIAPLLLIPFVENAFQYGIHNEAPSVIRLRIRIAKQQLVMQLENSIHGGLNHQGQGTGISQTKKRLGLLYPDHTLTITNTGRTFSVYLSIKLNSKI